MLHLDRGTVLEARICLKHRPSFSQLRTACSQDRQPNWRRLFCIFEYVSSCFLGMLIDGITQAESRVYARKPICSIAGTKAPLLSAIVYFAFERISRNLSIKIGRSGVTSQAARRIASAIPRRVPLPSASAEHIKWSDHKGITIRPATAIASSNLQPFLIPAQEYPFYPSWRNLSVFSRL